jgi:hypothetical protein
MKTNQEKIEAGISSIDDAIVIVAGKKLQVNTEFVMLFYESVGDLIDRKKVTLSDVRVLIAICQIARFGNLISLNQSTLAAKIGMKKQNLSKCIIKLCAENILLKTDFGLYLNPSIIVKGKFQTIEPEVWNEAINRGFNNPIKGFRKTSGKKEDETRDIFEDIEMPF